MSVPHTAPPPLVTVMGMSGSGKTTVGAALAQRLGVPFADADDFHPPENVAKMSAGIPLDDRDRLPWLQTVGAWLAEHAHTGAVLSSLVDSQVRTLEPLQADEHGVTLDLDQPSTTSSPRRSPPSPRRQRPTMPVGVKPDPVHGAVVEADAAHLAGRSATGRSGGIGGVCPGIITLNRRREAARPRIRCDRVDPRNHPVRHGGGSICAVAARRFFDACQLGSGTRGRACRLVRGRAAGRLHRGQRAGIEGERFGRFARRCRDRDPVVAMVAGAQGAAGSQGRVQAPSPFMIDQHP
jgi:gluconokinase